MSQRLHDLQVSYGKVMNRLAKWRSVFASWQLGTRSREDPECQAVKDQREATILLRAETNALLALLISKKVFTMEEWLAQVIDEARHLDALYQMKFPGFSSADTGINIKMPEAHETMKGWRP